MRIAVIALLLATSVAHADDAKDVEGAIRAVIDGEQSWMNPPTQYSKLAGVYLLGPSGVAIADEAALDGELHGQAAAGAPLGEIWWKLGAPTLAVDAKRGIAWFQAPVGLDLQFQWPGPANPRATDALRASGIVVRKDKRWQLVASGTAPVEYAAGAGAAKLAAAWDKLGMRAVAIEAETFGAIGIVRAGVQLPVKKRGAPMVLYAIAVADGATWRWVSLQFATELAKPPTPQQP